MVLDMLLVTCRFYFEAPLPISIRSVYTVQVTGFILEYVAGAQSLVSTSGLVRNAQRKLKTCSCTMKLLYGEQDALAGSLSLLFRLHGDKTSQFPP